MGFANHSALADLRALLTARDDADPAVHSSMRSVVLPGSPGGGAMILLHGLTASPPAWRAIAAALHGRGTTIVVPRLLGHGHGDRMSPALLGMRAAALVEDTRALVGAVAALGERITLAGHSLGGALALDAGAHDARLARVVAIAPFLGVARLPRRAHDLVVPLTRRLPNVFLWWDPALRERQMPAHGYPRYPTHALVEALALGEALRHRSEAPVVRDIDVVVNAHETSVNNRSATRLAAAWRARGASVALHRLGGLGPAHDVIEPERGPARRAFSTLVGILANPHRAGDQRHLAT